MVSGSLLLSGCGTSPKVSGQPLSSLCLMDFESQMCWYDKEKGFGYTFEYLNNSCKNGGPCWFALDEYDLTRIHKALNK